MRARLGGAVGEGALTPPRRIFDPSAAAAPRGGTWVPNRDGLRLGAPSPGGRGWASVKAVPRAGRGREGREVRVGAPEAVDVGEDGGGGLALLGDVGRGRGDLVQGVEGVLPEAVEQGAEVEVVEALVVVDRGRDGGRFEPCEEVADAPPLRAFSPAGGGGDEAAFLEEVGDGGPAAEEVGQDLVFEVGKAARDGLLRKHAERSVLGIRYPSSEQFVFLSVYLRFI